MNGKLTGLALALLLGTAQAADLSGVKTYLSGKISTQLAGTAALKAAADRYYDLAQKAGFDYARLARSTQARGGTAAGPGRVAEGQPRLRGH